jgi:methyltransferase (TIGR00027 family)
VARVRTAPDLPEPARPGTSRTALAALQTQAVLELSSPEGKGLAAQLYGSAAAHGCEHLETASDPAAYRAAVLAGTLPGPGHTARFAARKRWVADTATVAIAEGIRQVAVLGAGFDTLGLTLLQADAGLLVVELDRPAMVQAKQLALTAAMIAPPWPCSVAVDLADPHALTRALAATGWRLSEPALFVAELALEYLEPDAAVGVLSAVGALAGPESRIACTVRFGDLDDEIAAVTAAVGEPMRFRPLRAELPELLARAGLDVLASRDRILGRSGTTALLLLAPAKTPQAPGTTTV